MKCHGKPMILIREECIWFCPTCGDERFAPRVAFNTIYQAMRANPELQTEDSFAPQRIARAVLKKIQKEEKHGK